jgi:hypothetical protein
MNSLEDRLRAALRETAREVPQRSLPSLDLTRTVRVSARRAHGGVRMLTALSAAAAVAAVVVASAALAANSRQDGRGAGAPRPSGRPESSQAGAAPQPLPPYFLELRGTGSPYYDNPLNAAISATASGQTLAVITPPAPYGTFISGTAAADDRTFVLAAATWQPSNTANAVGINSGAVAFFLLRFDPADAQPALTRLNIPEIPAAEQVAGLALAPDGSQLAVATQEGISSQQITIYSLSTGAARTWTAAAASATLGGAAGAQNMVDMQGLSWTADGSTLAYDWWGPTPGVELLDVAGTGGSLLADSRLVVPQSRTGCAGDAMITPDGSAIVCAASWLPSWTGGVNSARSAPAGPIPTASAQAADIQVGFGEYSTRTGALLRVLDAGEMASTEPLTQQVLWSSSSGSELITESALPYLNRVAVVTTGQLTLLPAADQPAVPAIVW